MNSPKWEDWVALQALTADYWYQVDQCNGAGIGAYWTDDGVFHLEDSVMDGRAAIERFYSWRANRAPRVSLHVATNLRVRMVAPDQAELSSIVTLYAADGEAPIHGSVPIGVGPSDDLCTRNAAGGWRYARRHLRRVFVGSGEVTLPPPSPGTN